MKDETDKTAVLLERERSDGAEDREVRCTFRLPTAWSSTPASGSRVLLFPDDLEEFKDDRFAPNIVFDVAQGDDSDGIESTASVISSAVPGSSCVPAGQSGIEAHVIDGRVVVQLTREVHLPEEGLLSIACSALETQWASVAGAFDQVVDSLEVSESSKETSP
jgi:hypothetical protein